MLGEEQKEEWVDYWGGIKCTLLTTRDSKHNKMWNVK